VNEITSLDEFEALIIRSENEPVFIFKHSTTCPISARASDRVNQYVESKGGARPDFSFVKVIESRPVSNAIAEKLAVVHQSPQLILIHLGKGVWNSSHHNITGENIEAALEQALA
jgi:bacillithiol system protein YtxJ